MKWKWYKRNKKHFNFKITQPVKSSKNYTSYFILAIINVSFEVRGNETGRLPEGGKL